MIDECAQEKKQLSTITESLVRIASAIESVTETESVTLNNALGRVLAEPIYSTINSPFDRNSAMDGYAFSSTDLIPDLATTLKQVGISWAGQPYQGTLLAGQCVRIFTGAALPAETDSVVMQEQVQVEALSIIIPAQTKSQEHVRAVGEDIKQGDLVYAALKKISAIDLGLLASVGTDTVVVKRKVKIAFFSTGNELTALGQPLMSGKIYDSNRYLLSGLLTDACYQATDLGVIADNPQQIEACLLAAATNHDLIISTGGASVGDADYIKEVLARCGKVDFWKIAIKPGKPLAFGKIDDCHFFGLPGNPVAVIVTFQHIVAPALEKLSGLPMSVPLQLLARCTVALNKSPGRQEYQRGIFCQDNNGELLVSALGQQGSNILSATSLANCYIVLPVECSGIQPGELVHIELIKNVVSSVITH
jgi:molybdopterin molybdotransferase